MVVHNGAGLLVKHPHTCCGVVAVGQHDAPHIEEGEHVLEDLGADAEEVVDDRLVQVELVGLQLCSQMGEELLLHIGLEAMDGLDQFGVDKPLVRQLRPRTPVVHIRTRVHLALHLCLAVLRT